MCSYNSPNNIGFAISLHVAKAWCTLKSRYFAAIAPYHGRSCTVHVDLAIAAIALVSDYKNLKEASGILS